MRFCARGGRGGRGGGGGEHGGGVERNEWEEYQTGSAEQVNGSMVSDYDVCGKLGSDVNWRRVVLFMHM